MKIWEAVCVCVCVCARTHACVNKQIFSVMFCHLPVFLYQVLWCSSLHKTRQHSGHDLLWGKYKEWEHQQNSLDTRNCFLQQ